MIYLVPVYLVLFVIIATFDANMGALRDFWCVIYWVPVIVKLQLKVIRDPQFEAAVNVSTAGIDCPAGRTVFCWFHVRVR